MSRLYWYSTSRRLLVLYVKTSQVPYDVPISGRHKYLILGRHKYLTLGRHKYLILGRHKYLILGCHKYLISGRHKYLILGRHTYLILGRHKYLILGRCISADIPISLCFIGTLKKWNIGTSTIFGNIFIRKYSPNMILVSSQSNADIDTLSGLEVYRAHFGMTDRTHWDITLTIMGPYSVPRSNWIPVPIFPRHKVPIMPSQYGPSKVPTRRAQ